MLSALTIVWSVATGILVVLLIYRALLSNREDDQIFLGAGEEHLQQQQLALQLKMQSVGKYSMIFGVLSGVLLLALAGLWTYQQINTPPIT